MRGNKIRIARALAVLSLIAGMSGMAKADSLILPQKSSDPIIFPVSTAGQRPETLIKVFAAPEDACCDGRTPMAGWYSTTGDAITFAPAFGFDPGQDYVASVQDAEGRRLVAFRIGSEMVSPSAQVTEVFPSGDVLPENILRFYIHFSVPMKPHVAFDYITLRDASGRVDDAAFMRFKQELWNADRTRLTLLIDPGRIKRNVATNVALGPALLAGQSYTLWVDAGWPTANGKAVLSAFEKTFTVTTPLRERPDVRLWSIAVPCAGTREPLLIDFDRSFDRHLLERAIRVRTEDGQEIKGMIAVGEGEHSWNFTPGEQWPQERLQLDVSPTLEDVAANNFNDLLDHVASDVDATPGSIEQPIVLAACSDEQR